MSDSSSHDQLYHDGDQPTPFRFDERVARVFPDMIERSVPGYALVLELIGLAASRYAQSGSRLYDLGCSLGAATLAMRHAVGGHDTTLVAVDNAPAMVARCREHVAADDGAAQVEVIEADLVDIKIEDASVVVLNFTLQFVPPAGRPDLVQRIYAGLRPGGVLLLAEKVALPAESPLVDWHLDFKRSRGYSELEVARKRTALENVLRPDSEQAHEARLREAGFADVQRWFQCLPFVAWLATK